MEHGGVFLLVAPLFIGLVWLDSSFFCVCKMPYAIDLFGIVWLVGLGKKTEIGWK